MYFAFHKPLSPCRQQNILLSPFDYSANQDQGFPSTSILIHNLLVLILKKKGNWDIISICLGLKVWKLDMGLCLAKSYKDRALSVHAICRATMMQMMMSHISSLLVVMCTSLPQKKDGIRSCQKQEGMTKLCSQISVQHGVVLADRLHHSTTSYPKVTRL
uniref:Uncharacterized protein n=1 Tax=Salix viminalis TaxID=40686 RepID=A0A6N2K9Q7_SALVM